MFIIKKFSAFHIFAASCWGVVDSYHSYIKLKTISIIFFNYKITHLVTHQKFDLHRKNNNNTHYIHTDIITPEVRRGRRDNIITVVPGNL